MGTETLLLVLIASICYIGFGFKTLLYFISNKSVVLKDPIFRIVIFLFWFVVPIGIVFGGEKQWKDD